MRQSEHWRAIAVPMKAHSKQKGLQPRMHEPDDLKYGKCVEKIIMKYNKKTSFQSLIKISALKMVCSNYTS